MLTIRAVGMIFYRTMVITFLFIIATNIFPNSALGYNSLWVGLAVGLIGSILSGIHKPWYA